MGAANTTAELFKSITEMPDPGASGTVTVQRSPVICNLVSATTETRTIANPTQAGALLTLHMFTDGGDITVTFSTAFTEHGATTFVFSEVGQTLTVQSIRTSSTAYAWRKISDYAIANRSVSRTVTVTDATTYTVLAADSGKIHIMPDFTADCTLTLPTAADGLEYTFIGKGIAADAHSWIFKSPSATNFFLGGASHTDTDDPADTVVAVYPNGSSNDFHTVLAPGGGTKVYMVCDGTNWIVSTQVNGATAPTFSDS